GAFSGQCTPGLGRTTGISSWALSPGPTWLPFSRTTTLAPALASAYATGAPPAPLPTTTTSADELAMGRMPGLAWLEADQLPAASAAIAPLRRVARRALPGE